jgi:hypothetical protein
VSRMMTFRETALRLSKGITPSGLVDHRPPEWSVPMPAGGPKPRRRKIHKVGKPVPVKRRV